MCEIKALFAFKRAILSILIYTVIRVEIYLRFILKRFKTKYFQTFKMFGAKWILMDVLDTLQIT